MSNQFIYFLATIAIVDTLLLALIYQLMKKEAVKTPLHNRISGHKPGKSANIESYGPLDAEHLTEAYDNGYIQGLSDYLQFLLGSYDLGKEFNTIRFEAIMKDCNSLYKVSRTGKFFLASGSVIFDRHAWLKGE